MEFSLGSPSRMQLSDAEAVRLPREMAHTLEETTLLQSDLVEGSDFKCPITHEMLSPGDSVIKLPCGHIFEPNSIKQWLTGRAGTCPVCRASLPGARTPTPAITTQPVAVVSQSERVALHRQNIEALAQSILDLQERQMIRLSERRANRLLQSIQRDVNELRDLGYVPSIALSSILPTRPPLHAPRYNPFRTVPNFTEYTRQWLDEAGRDNRE